MRGLDYYTRTTFEVSSGALGAQNSVLGGGRYDGLVKELGGPDLTGIGFALGMERLVMLLPAGGATSAAATCSWPRWSRRRSTRRSSPQRALRAPGVRVLMDHEGRGLKSQMKKADKLGARFVAILGEDELAAGAWTVRDMGGSSQEAVPDDAPGGHFKEKLDG